MVGWLDARTREHLLRILINVVRQDVEGIVDQFVQMGVVEWGKYDRRHLERDLLRFLNHYRGISFQEWQMREMVNDLMRLTFRHHLRFPSELWLLTKTLSMMEGLARQLDPTFELFSVMEPYAQDLYLDSLSLRAMGKRTVESLADWGEELLLLPQQIRRMIEQFEQGSIQVTIRDEGWSVQFGRLDRMASRIAASLLIAAFVIAVTLLIPLLANEPWRIFAAALIILSFVNATILTVWLVVSSLPWRAR
jgi:ubiquinone biosynthesis protein